MQEFFGFILSIVYYTVFSYTPVDLQVCESFLYLDHNLYDFKKNMPYCSAAFQQYENTNADVCLLRLATKAWAYDMN